MFQALRDSIAFDYALQTLQSYLQNLSVSSAVMTVLMAFMVVGLVDKLGGNRLGYGAQFEAGFLAMGDLALAILGIISLSPVLLLVFEPIVSPLCRLIGASPAIFASLIAVDQGGYALALQLAGEADPAAGQYMGLIVSSMLGITVCFTIPYALRMTGEEDRGILGTGILIGIVTMPVGCLIGGLLMVFTSTPISLSALWANTLPVILLAAVVASGLAFRPALMMRGFVAFGRILTVVVAVSPVVAIFQYVTGIHLPLFYRMVVYDPILKAIPLESALLMVGQIAIVLCGAFPFIHFLSRRLAGPLDWLGSRLGIDPEAAAGLPIQLANSIPVWSRIGRMNDRGKLLNVAFAVSGSYTIGDVLAFVGGVNPEMVFPMLAGKLSAGVLAIWLAAALSRTPRILPIRRIEN